MYAFQYNVKAHAYAYVSYKCAYMHTCLCFANIVSQNTLWGMGACFTKMYVWKHIYICICIHTQLQCTSLLVSIYILTCCLFRSVHMHMYSHAQVLSLYICIHTLTHKYSTWVSLRPQTSSHVVSSYTYIYTCRCAYYIHACVHTHHGAYIHKQRFS